MNVSNRLFAGFRPPGFVARILAVLVAVSLAGDLGASAEETQCPALWGVAKMTFLVSDYGVARDYYGRFLGFSEAFSYPSERGKVISFKVSDRQFLEFIQDPQAKSTNRLVSVSLETEDAEAMRRYLQEHGQKVPEKTVIDGAGNEVFLMADPAENPIEFISFRADGLHRKSKGRFLSDRRISKRIHHAGLYAEKFSDEDPFYVGLLKFKEVVRFPEDRTSPPTLLYLGMGDCVENIEFTSPSERSGVHPCLLVEDMQETIYALKERRVNETLAKPTIGRGKRWILNLYNSDRTRVEFTEAHCVR